MVNGKCYKEVNLVKNQTEQKAFGVILGNPELEEQCGQKPDYPWVKTERETLSNLLMIKRDESYVCNFRKIYSRRKMIKNERYLKIFERQREADRV